uniref:3-phosphoshikimate 1-carboxyvinyltransferase (AroA) n=1 Tax=uncultured marine thaumarchaeote AD1000_04_G03 TaxID=1455882 RepID=A0A075FLF5_9ARCH|nr:3-phosphoshikimate 1-carboxyvinyltransferase (aroA) [uncultured marine thaumarchaeote AD1000_04_G03]
MTGADLNSENDHRLFMAFCIAGMYVGNCTISDPESVDISYPDFISEMKRIGCKIFLD